MAAATVSGSGNMCDVHFDSPTFINDMLSVATFTVSTLRLYNWSLYKKLPSAYIMLTKLSDVPKPTFTGTGGTWLAIVPPFTPIITCLYFNKSTVSLYKV